MNWLEEVSALGTAANEDDRRWDTRRKILKRVRVRHVDTSREDEVGTMIDLSRDGLYFAVRSHQYRVGMEIRLLFPQGTSSCCCEVVRTEPLANGHFGIGVRILEWQPSGSSR